MSIFLERVSGFLPGLPDSYRVLGGPGSGHYGHEGRKGKVGGSEPSDVVPGTGGDIIIIKKAKAPPATKGQIAHLVSLKKQNYSYAHIQKETGLNPKQAATIWFKYNKAQAAAEEILVEKHEQAKKAKPYKNFGTAIDPATWKAPAAESGYFQVDGANVFVAKGQSLQDVLGDQKAMHGVITPPPVKPLTPIQQEQKEWLEKQTYTGSNVSTSKTAPLPPDVNELVDIVQMGYTWKAKESGPNAGKFAFFKDGIQVSAFTESEHDWKKAAETAHFGKGIGWKELPPPPVPGKIGGQSGLIADPLGSYGDDLDSIEPWPIDDDVVRKQGTKYVAEIRDIGDKWATKLTPDERNAIHSYTGASSATNRALWDSGILSTEKSKKIDSGLAKSPDPPPPELVWRGIPSVNPSALQASLTTGDIIKLKGFQSTSVRPETAAGWSAGKTLFEIKPKKGAYVQVVSSHPEKEFLLPHGKKYLFRGTRMVPIGTKNEKRLVFQFEMLDD